MKNQYENNLRTHYSPIRKNKSNFNHCKSYKSYFNNKSYDYKKNININATPCEKMNPSRNKISIKNQFYKSINNPYFNYHIKKKNISKDLNEKEKLTKSFNRINPFYFQDNVKSLEKEKINKKIINRILLQREAIKQLSIDKINNPSEKEKLQKINEQSNNPMVSYESKHPLQIKTLENYYYNDYLIKTHNINIYNQPRKEIEDYYNKCQYQPPLNINNDSIIHTKPNYIFPNYEKNILNEQKLKEELDMQVQYKNNQKKNKLNEDKNNLKIMHKIYNDYETFLKNKEKKEKYNLEKEIILDNKLLENYKKYKNKYFHEGEKDSMKNIQKKMEEEDLQKKYEEKKEKLKTKKNLIEWGEINETIKKIKKNEKNKEKKIWRNYSDKYIIKCKHGKEFYICYGCGKKYSKDQIHKIIF